MSTSATLKEIIKKSEEAEAIQEMDNENIWHRHSWQYTPVLSQELLDT